MLGENVPGLIHLALDTVLLDLEEEGYAVQPFVIPACGVDAPHRRDRVCIVAHAIDGSAVMRRHRELGAATEAGAGWKDDGGGIEAPERGERQKNESGTDRMADGIRTAVYPTDPDTDGNGLQTRMYKTVLGGANYDMLLRSFLEVTPLGRIGPMNPAYLKYVMGYPIGWTELSASETR